MNILGERIWSAVCLVVGLPAAIYCLWIAFAIHHGVARLIFAGAGLAIAWLLIVRGSRTVRR